MSTTRQKSQKQAILEHMQNGWTITPLEALNQYGCMRLADIVFRLKKDGYDVRTEMVTKGDKTYAKYRLMTAPEQEGLRI